VAGFTFKPSDDFEWTLQGGWLDSDAGLRPFDFVVPARFENANQSYDFTLTHLASDLEVSQVDVDTYATYRFSDDLWVRFGYRYADFTDDVPYLVDLSGSISLVSLGVGKKF
jgi:hypothetical protein